ncbi:nuclear transport factor 2 family protein [Rhizobium sp. WSM1274]|uniref:nuclear transport factor 2 family protein n=1 Tax=unclassified Rhizobium TaxID=2613769 RepID=UPI0021A358EF|nr:nuclear transport factor 2 family protein [Rhizobium leguminosarum]UWM81632.1 nuclear transport factor 2 family protein [Rhizobium leguminosarum bv. viciae]UWU28342.1 nuclear transport factor 2 family protein [Rhizobium leguminosarum bv. viciae]
MTTIDIGKAYIKAVQTGDQATLGELLSPQVIWHQPGNNQFSGTKNGIVEFGAMMAKSGGSFAITHAHRYLANGDLVAIEIQFAGQREGAKVDQPGIDLLRVQDGKIVEVWLFSSDPEEEDQFWGK